MMSRARLVLLILLEAGPTLPASATAGSGSPPLLVPGHELRLSLDGDEGRAVLLRLRAGDHGAVRLVRQTAPVALVLVDPSGTERRRVIRDPAETADSDCPLPARPDAAWVADAAGTWTLRVLPPAGVAPVEVALVAERRRPASEADRRAWEADLLDARVTGLLDDGRAAEAVEAARALVEAHEREHRGDRVALASDLAYLGRRFALIGACQAGTWDAAETYVRRALLLRAAALPERDLCVAESRSLLASVLYARGSYEEGESLEKAALAAKTAAGPAAAPQRRAGLRDVGLLLLKQGKYTEAEPFLRGVLEAIDREPAADAGARARALQALGELLRAQDRYDEARARFQEARTELERAPAPDFARLADVTSSLAGLYLDRAEYGDAEREARRFLDILDAHPDVLTPERRVIGLNNLGEIYRRQGRLEDAEAILADALAAAREALCPENPTLLFFRNNLAMLYADRGERERAEALYRESLEATERALGPRHPSVAQCLHDLGGLLQTSGRAAEAVPLVDRALAIREEVFGPDHPVTASTRLARARALLDAGNPPERVLAEVQRARTALAASAVDPESEVEAGVLEADLLRRLGHRDESVAALERALLGIERLRPRRGGGEGTRADFLRRHLGDYDRRIAWAVESGDAAAAFAWTERSRARAFLDVLTLGTGDVRRSVAPAERARLEARESEAAAELAEAQARATFERARADLSREDRRRRLVDLDGRVDRAARALRLAQDDFRAHSPLWRDAITAAGGTVAAEEARHGVLLPPGGWLLEYRIGAEASWLFALPADGGSVEAIPLALDGDEARTLGVPPGPITTAMLETILTGRAKGGGVPLLLRLASPPSSVADDEEETVSLLAVLRRALIPDRLWRRVRRAPDVILVPDGSLLMLPFEALVTRGGRDWRAARLWLDDGPVIRYAVSATSIVNLARRPAVPATGPPPAPGRPPAAASPWVLSVSDPNYAGRYPPLPGTARESSALRDAFRSAGFPDAVKVLAGDAASEPAVRAALPGMRYLHFATHGLVDPRRSDLLAGLALATPPGTPPGPEADGLFQLFEIDATRVDAELVVLSACDSGVGRRIEGEGVFSLARGFFAAGARRVVATLWPVSDTSSADLVGELFRRMADDDAAARDARPAVALRDAKRLLRSRPDTAAPFYWAPFTYSGLP
jgi:tetratricopeptide (TPR) repeat protein